MLLALCLTKLLLTSTTVQAALSPAQPILGAPEKQTFALKFVGATAGLAKFETLPIADYHGRPAYHFKATIETTGLFWLLYPFTQTTELFIDRDQALPVFVDIHVKDRAKSQHTVIRLNNSALKGEEIEDSMEDAISNHRVKAWPIPKKSQSLFSIMQFLRLQKLTPGTEVSFPVAHDQDSGNFVAKVTGIEKLTIEGVSTPAVVVELGGEFMQRAYKTLEDPPRFWFSNDAQKRLLQFELPHRKGKVLAVLTTDG